MGMAGKLGINQEFLHGKKGLRNWDFGNFRDRFHGIRLRSRINCNPGNEKYMDLVVEKVRNPRNSELDPSWSSWAGVRNPREEENRENPGNSALGSAPL